MDNRVRVFLVARISITTSPPSYSQVQTRWPPPVGSSRPRGSLPTCQTQCAPEEFSEPIYGGSFCRCAPPPVLLKMTYPSWPTSFFHAPARLSLRPRNFALLEVTVS